MGFEEQHLNAITTDGKGTYLSQQMKSKTQSWKDQLPSAPEVPFGLGCNFPSLCGRMVLGGFSLNCSASTYKRTSAPSWILKLWMSSFRPKVAVWNPPGRLSPFYKGKLLASVDTKDAYLHVPIFSLHQHFLHFSVGHSHLQSVVLTFWPFICTSGVHQDAYPSTSDTNCSRLAQVIVVFRPGNVMDMQ